MSRLTAALFAALLLFSPTAWSQEGPATFALDLDPSTPGIQSTRQVAPGDVFTADLVAEGVSAAAPLHAFELDVVFDPASGISFTSVTDGGFLNPRRFELENSVGSGRISFAQVTLGPDGVGGQGLLAVLTATAPPSEGALELTLQDVLAATSAPPGAELPVTVISTATLDVVEEEEEPQEPTPIPTLGEWGLILLALALAFFALSVLGGRNRARPAGGLGLVLILGLVTALAAAPAQAQQNSPDIDGDTWVTALDASIAGACHGQDVTTTPECQVADLDGSGTVDDADLAILRDVFGTRVQPDGNTAPVAVAGEDRIGRLGDTFVLDGSGSSDPDGDDLAFRWEVIDAPPGVNVQLSDSSAAVSRVIVDRAGDLTLRLTVDDGFAQAADEVVIVVDLDGDGIPAGEDPDRDGDGVPNEQDDFPDDPSEIVDSDGDGVGNASQEDEDGDGVTDDLDELPFEPASTVYPEHPEVEFNGNLGAATAIDVGPPFRLVGDLEVLADLDAYGFELPAGTTVAAVVRADSVSARPQLTFFGASGEALRDLRPDLSPGSGVAAAAAVHAEQQGTYFLLVSDSRAGAARGYPYQVELFIDGDLDAADDAREKAQGSDWRRDDSDGDGLHDLAELAPTLSGSVISDLEGDGIPQWLDRESDGDAVPDGAEGATDPDRDGLGSFLELDADGNGLSDFSDAGSDFSRPDDLTGDGRVDLADLDDDGDTVVDSIDPDPRSPMERGDPFDPSSIQILDARTAIGSSTVGRIATPGRTLVLQGTGFTTPADENIVIFSGPFEPINLPAASVGQEELTVEVPERLAGQRVRVAVFAGDRLSNAVSVSVLSPVRPLLVPPVDPEVPREETLVLAGVNLPPNPIVSFDGLEVPGRINGDGDVEVTVPTGATSGPVQVHAGGRWLSNAVYLRILSPMTAEVILPKAASITMDDLSIGYGLVAEARPATDGFARIGGTTAQPSLVQAFLLDAEGEISGVYLQALAVPGDTHVTLDARSTATATVLQALAIAFQRPMAPLADVRDDVAALPEVGTLANALEPKLSGDPSFLPEMDPPTRKLLEDAALKAVPLVEDVLNAQQSARTDRARFVPPEPPTVTPEAAHGFEVVQPSELLEEGHVAVSNDTHLFASARFVDLATGNVLAEHASDYLDRRIIAPRGNGVFGWSLLGDGATVKADYGQCGFRDCRVEVATPGLSSPSAAGEVEVLLKSRVAAERLIYPFLSPLLGDVELDGPIAKAMISYLRSKPFLVRDQLRRAAEDGEWVKAALDLVGGFLTSAAEGRVIGAVAEAVATKIAKRLGVALVPGVGPAAAIAQIGSDVYDVVKASFTAGNVIDDLLETPGQVDFAVDYELKILDRNPEQVTPAEERDVAITVAGQGFLLPQGDPARLPTILIDDEGSDEQIELTPTEVTAGELEAVLPAAFLQKVTGPLAILVGQGGPGTGAPVETAESPLDIQVRGTLAIHELQPDDDQESDGRVTIRGSGFEPSKNGNTVTFQTTGGRGNATVVAATRDELEVIPPAAVATGPVVVERLGEKSNQVTYSVFDATVEIVFGDNGTATDDIFHMEIDRVPVYMGSEAMERIELPLRLEPGVHTVTLRGVRVEDDEGTYFIEFPENVKVLDGSDLDGNDPITADDLNEGVVKHWIIEVAEPTAGPSGG